MRDEVRILIDGTPDKRLSINAARRTWTLDEKRTLARWYEEREGRPLQLPKLCALLGRSQASVKCKANDLCLSHDKNRPKKARPKGRPRKFKTDKALKAYQSERSKAYIATNGHPRGALGMKHTEANKQKMLDATVRYRAGLSQEERSAIGRLAAMTRLERYGTAGPVNQENPYSRTKSGKRADLDGVYFRSSWEANYARYLSWLQEQGEIQGWEYEAEVFVFHGETRGAITYRPDFKITERDGEVVFHEVKGWMDGPSKTRLRRMKKHYPDIKVIVIGEAEYKALSKWKGLIPEWE